jgi:hypothetical protein
MAGNGPLRLWRLVLYYRVEDVKAIGDDLSYSGSKAGLGLRIQSTNVRTYRTMFHAMAFLPGDVVDAGI